VLAGLGHRKTVLANVPCGWVRIDCLVVLAPGGRVGLVLPLPCSHGNFSGGQKWTAAGFISGINAGCVVQYIVAHMARTQNPEPSPQSRRGGLSGRRAGFQFIVITTNSVSINHQLLLLQLPLGTAQRNQSTATLFSFFQIKPRHSGIERESSSLSFPLLKSHPGITPEQAIETKGQTDG
jgi:hypothetical protein